MSIWVGSQTRLLTQGMTGQTGLFHTQGALSSSLTHAADPMRSDGAIARWLPRSLAMGHRSHS